MAALDVLRRNDGAAEVKAGRAIEVADRRGDRGEVGLRDLFPEIGLIGRCDSVARNRRAPVNETLRSTNSGLESAWPAGRATRGIGNRVRRRPRLLGLQGVETLFGLPRIEAGLAGLLRLRRAGRWRPASRGTAIEPVPQLRCTAARIRSSTDERDRRSLVEPLDA